MMSPRRVIGNLSFAVMYRDAVWQKRFWVLLATVRCIVAEAVWPTASRSPGLSKANLLAIASKQRADSTLRIRVKARAPIRWPASSAFF